jgi:hypothetical protein
VPGVEPSTTGFAGSVTSTGVITDSQFQLKGSGMRHTLVSLAVTATAACESDALPTSVGCVAWAMLMDSSVDCPWSTYAISPAAATQIQSVFPPPG